MRKMPLLAALVMFASWPADAGRFDPDGKFKGKVSAAIQIAIHAFERTHDGVALRKSIARLVEHDPALVDDAIEVGRGLPPEGQTDIAKALAAAYADLAASHPKSAGLIGIKAALAFATQTLQTAFNTEANQLLGVASASAGGAGGNGGGAAGNGGGAGGFGGGVGASSPIAPTGSVSPN